MSVLIHPLLTAVAGLLHTMPGTIYLRQERIELAEYHFKRAIAINPTSSVLQTYLGMVLNAYDRWGQHDRHFCCNISM